RDPSARRVYPPSLHDALPIFARKPGGIKISPKSSRAGAPLAQPAAKRPQSAAHPIKQQVRGQTRSPRAAKPHVDRDECAVSENRSEEHTSELQSRENLVCRLL